MNKNYAWLVVCISLIIVTGVIAFGFRKPAVYVAIVSSLTGTLAENGKDTANGAKMAFDELNLDSNAIIHYQLFDDQGDPKTAVAIANQICQDSRYIAVVGHLTSGCMSAAAEVYAKNGMPVAMPVPTNPRITQLGYQSLFRIPPTDDDQAPFLALYLLSKDPIAPVAIVNDLTSYGLGFANAFRDKFRSAGGNIVAFEGAKKESRDYKTLIAKLKELHPKYVVIGATYDMGAPFVRQMKEMGLKATAIAGDGCYGSAFLQQAGNAGEGSIVSFIAPDRGVSPKAVKFFKEYERKYGKVVSYAPLGYDAAEVIINAIEKATDKSRKGIVSEIKKQGFFVDGVTGRIEFNNNGDNKNKNISIYVVSNNKFKLLNQ